MSEGKASAQSEAAEWKRKYEIEKARNLQLEHKGFVMIKLHELRCRYWLHALHK